MINFDSSAVFGTPSYYVQQMFSQNRGDMVLPDNRGDYDQCRPV